jgi:mono/diheme cytochrome c family protein
MKPASVVLVIVVAALGLIAAAAASILHNGLSARARPTRLETVIARNLRNWMISAKARNLHNPISASEESLRQARMHFADHCASCHANDGSGSTMYGDGLYPKPPDLRLPATQNLSDGEIFWIIENGVRFTGMPAFGGHHGTTDDSWKLVLFIRRLPHLPMDERLEMERNNPKSPEDRKEEQEEEDFLRDAPLQQKAPAAHPDK